jgi:hypothetical protein
MNNEQFLASKFLFLRAYNVYFQMYTPKDYFEQYVSQKGYMPQSHYISHTTKIN